MSENAESKRNVGNDEIDLLDLFRRIGKGFTRLGKALGRGFLISVIFIAKRWLPLSLSIVAGFGLSILAGKLATSFYTSDLVLKINLEPADQIISYVNRLSGSGKQQLAEILSLNQSNKDNIQNIRGIDAYWIIDKGNDSIPDFVDYSNGHNIYDTVNVRMKDRMSVRVRVSQPQELSNIRDGIIKFINSDTLLQQRNAMRIKQSQDLLARIEFNISQIDSLQKHRYSEESKSVSQMVFLQEHKNPLLYPDIHKLYKQKQKIERDLFLYSDIVTVLSDFSTLIERDNSSSYYSKNLVPMFFLLTLLVLIIVTNRKKLKALYTKY